MIHRPPAAAFALGIKSLSFLQPSSSSFIFTHSSISHFSSSPHNLRESPTTMASMDHIDAARARLHSLFNTSFEKLDDALSNASTTVSHKAHCYRVDIHLLSVLCIIHHWHKRRTRCQQLRRGPCASPITTWRHIHQGRDLIEDRHQSLCLSLTSSEYSKHLVSL